MYLCYVLAYATPRHVTPRTTLQYSIINPLTETSFMARGIIVIAALLAHDNKHEKCLLLNL